MKILDSVHRQGSPRREDEDKGVHDEAHGGQDVDECHDTQCYGRGASFLIPTAHDANLRVQ